MVKAAEEAVEEADEAALEKEVVALAQRREISRIALDKAHTEFFKIDKEHGYAVARLQRARGKRVHVE